jgi:hypothetical protein
MDTMVEIESRIRIAEQDGRQDVALLKIARNALTPIGRLPSELLVYLVQKLLELTEIGGVPQALLSVTSVCSRIRVVLVDAPVLWSRLVFLDRRWTKPICNLFLIRAVPHPLEVTFGLGWDPSRASSYKDAGECLPRIGSLSTYLAGQPGFLSMLQSTDMPLLKTLKLVSFSSVTVSPNADILTPMSCTCVRSLYLHQVQIATIPHFPTLRFLHLSHANCPFQQVKALILRTPALFSVTLVDAVQRDTTEEVPCEAEPGHAAELAHRTLDTLIIRETLIYVLGLISILPVPSHIFDVEITLDLLSPPTAWSSSVGPNALVMSRIRQFWTSTMKNEQLFPAGEVTWEHIHGGFRQQILYEAVERRDERSLLRFASPCRIKDPDPNVDDVTTLRVHTTRHTISSPHDLAVTDLQLHCLPNVEHLVVSVSSHEAYLEDDRPRMQILEDWISARHREGRPLRSITFASCPNQLMDLFNRLRDQQTASSVTWEDGGSDSSLIHTDSLASDDNDDDYDFHTQYFSDQWDSDEEESYEGSDYLAGEAGGHWDDIPGSEENFPSHLSSEEDSNGDELYAEQEMEGALGQDEEGEVESTGDSEHLGGGLFMEEDDMPTDHLDYREDSDGPAMFDQEPQFDNVQEPELEGSPEDSDCFDEDHHLEDDEESAQEQDGDEALEPEHEDLTAESEHFEEVSQENPDIGQISEPEDDPEEEDLAGESDHFDEGSANDYFDDDAVRVDCCFCFRIILLIYDIAGRYRQRSRLFGLRGLKRRQDVARPAAALYRVYNS